MMEVFVMTREKKIEYLSDYKNIVKECNDLSNRYDHLIAKDGLKAHVITDMPTAHGGTCDPMSDNVCEIDKLEIMIKKRYDMLKKTILKVETAINDVEESLFRILLSRRYIDNFRWEEIAVDMKFNIRNIYRIHDEAIEKIEIHVKELTERVFYR